MALDFQDFTVDVNDTIQTAMLKITHNRHRVVIVLDGKRVVGTVSDGDLRRAFLKEVLSLAPVHKIMNLNCTITRETESARQQEVILREKVTVLPVVNDDQELVDIVLAYEPFSD